MCLPGGLPTEWVTHRMGRLLAQQNGQAIVQPGPMDGFDQRHPTRIFRVAQRGSVELIPCKLVSADHRFLQRTQGPYPGLHIVQRRG